MKNFKDAEILSPAGNWEMLRASVRSGADAVYLGAKDFSARRNAENFDTTELLEVVKYCHIRGVRVYLTLNILIKDEEMADAFNLAKTAYNSGIDGIIIADLGLARILHEKIPQLPLHASTQMTVHSPSALNFLKELGFCQVVAAREMSKAELALLCEKARQLDMTVEVFVHGALCMCMSGQCLLSAFLGSRSGNRGLCAGPCRLPFKVKNGTGYDLSLKDLSLLKYLNELYEIGVRSFKIEGRMKRPEYAAAATAACRQAITKGFANDNLTQTLKDVFSRSGFTDGYYTQSLGKNMFGIRTKEDVISAEKAFPRLHEIYRAERKSVPLKVDVTILKNSPVCITLYDGKNQVTIKTDPPKQAKTRALTKEDVIKNIDKFGATPYYTENISIDLDEGLFVAAGELNALRRQACEELDQKRSEIIYDKSQAVYSPKNITAPVREKVKLYARFSFINQIPDDISALDGIIIPLEENPPVIEENILKIVDIPRGIHSEKLIADRLELFKNFGFTTALCGNLAAVIIAKEKGFKIMADAFLNISNTECLETLKLKGVQSALVSNELTYDQIKNMGKSIPLGLVSYGNIPLMLFRNCPIKNGIDCAECDKKGVIVDRKGVEFPVSCRMGYSELFNSVPLWLGDKIKELDIDFSLLYFTREDKSRAETVINAFKNFKEPDTKYTRGLFFRGTI